MVNESNSRFFNIDIGLRQGCLISPILFAIYINGLEEINRENLNNNVKILMFADDIALIADSRESLDKLMQITFQYSKKWRFAFNYDKCAVMVFGNHQLSDQEMKYGSCQLECTYGIIGNSVPS